MQEVEEKLIRHKNQFQCELLKCDSNKSVAFVTLYSKCLKIQTIPFRENMKC